jgi:hypothetical protein
VHVSQNRMGVSQGTYQFTDLSLRRCDCGLCLILIALYLIQCCSNRGHTDRIGSHMGLRGGNVARQQSEKSVRDRLRGGVVFELNGRRVA